MPYGWNRFDPFQVFEVEHMPCMLFYIKIVKGYNITKGSYTKDWLDIPDPYVTVSIKTSPHGIQRTKHLDNDINPVWNETFKFYLNADVNNDMEISLFDANYLIDEHLSTHTINLSSLPLLTETVKQRVQFNQTSEVDIEMWAEYDNNPQLRYSLALCEEEKLFMEKRRECVYQAMQEILGDEAPNSINEVPTIGVLGSGGGFRAMTAFCGVMSGLVESKISDMVMYNVGLSGSAWYLSTLYSHPDWPKKSPRELRKELRDSIDSSPFWKLNPSSMWRYLSRIQAKRSQGQPVSFTDFFGHLVGETLLQGRLDSKLTDQQQKLKDGKIPMPMYSCLHVKKHVSAMVFHEWMEFSPYEIGMPKYGTFMAPELFGSKFFIGHLVKKYEEPPLHFLQGIWGSAFCIQFKRLLQDDKKVNQLEEIQQEREELDRELSEEMSLQDSESSDTSDSEGDENNKNSSNEKNKKNSQNGTYPPKNGKKKNGTKEKKRDSIFTSFLGSLFDTHPFLKSIDGRAATVHNFMRGLSLYKAYPFSPFTSIDDRSRNDQDKLQASSYFSKKLKGVSPKKRTNSGADDFDTVPQCSGGQEVLLQQELARPLFSLPSESDQSSPGTDQFDGIFEMYPTSIKKLYVVDGGLSFNSPFPLLLRPQRGVDLILSFDFSARGSDTTPPFKELMLAMKWARLNDVPFPDIDPTVVDREGLKECYVFENPKDPRCPIVMHFVLLNTTFREFKAPGRRRRTKEEKEYADFEIFDDPNRPYSTFNFKYTNLAFDRLADLMEFNTLLCKDLIVENIKKCVKRVERFSAMKKKPIMLKDIKKLNLKKSKEKQLEHFVKSIDIDDGDVPL
ncbi:cytosolic phospholipase A2-like isoform X2 [Mercenaria mercenaria]|uniref:cytosolic phospholipase A2-like isoform X2 n=1 Tax=Mercenaria mercenaria TaxID=6596 RepID=UPI00234EE4C7|nr:cytosolic phospholipase A2-like isoform X2 [Mercenaria mercenaria]XP_045199102.2 cytosolic phospholipase A2-like isoform X2 [Mercenaria mercenaria]